MLPAMGQDTCISVVGVTPDEVKAANERLNAYCHNSRAPKFEHWEETVDGEHLSEGFISCHDRWFDREYPRGKWPYIAAYLVAARQAWPGKTVWYYPDSVGPTDGYPVIDEVLERLWAVWFSPGLRQDDWYFGKRGCDHQLLVEAGEYPCEFPHVGPAFWVTVHCPECQLHVKQPIRTMEETKPIVQAVSTPGAGAVFARLLEADPTVAWPDAAGAALASVL